jgi:hypothetical protein
LASYRCGWKSSGGIVSARYEMPGTAAGSSEESSATIYRCRFSQYGCMCGCVRGALQTRRPCDAMRPVADHPNFAMRQQNAGYPILWILRRMGLQKSPQLRQRRVTGPVNGCSNSPPRTAICKRACFNAKYHFAGRSASSISISDGLKRKPCAC